MKEGGLYFEYEEGDYYGFDLIFVFSPKDRDLFVGLQLWNIMVGIGYIF